jgi:hypothetical protein
MRRRLVCVSLLVSAACEGTPSRNSSTPRVDTIAGVIRIDHRGPGPVWRLERSVEIGRLGGQDSVPRPDEFGRISWLALDGRGRVYVADAAAYEIRVFDTTGAHVRTIGPRGAGPGEFGSLLAIGFLGDTLVVLDGGNARLTLLDTAGVPLGQWRYGRYSGPGPEWLRQLGADTLAIMAFRPRVTERPARAYVKFTRAGPGDTIMAPPPPERVVSRGMDCEGAGGAIHVHITPLAPRHHAVVAPGGGYVSAWSDIYRVAFITAAGDTTRVVERTTESFLASDTMRARVDSEYAAFRRTPGIGRCSPPDLPDYEILPPIRTLIFDDEGRLWVDVRDAAGPRVDVFARDGALLGTARGDAGLSLQTSVVRNGRLAVVEDAPEGHTRVVVYRIVEGGAER